MMAEKGVLFLASLIGTVLAALKRDSRLICAFWAAWLWGLHLIGILFGVWRGGPFWEVRWQYNRLQEGWFELLFLIPFGLAFSLWTFFHEWKRKD